LRYADRELAADEAVRRAVGEARRHQRLIRSRIDMLRQYAEGRDCRRRFLLGYFGEQREEPCGQCDTCKAGTSQTRRPEPGREAEPDPGLEPDASVRHAEWGRGTVLSVEPDRLTVLFDEQGYKTLSRDAVRHYGLLTPAD
jgi:ATP-dependent DNA helicase RecQ